MRFRDKNGPTLYPILANRRICRIFSPPRAIVRVSNLTPFKSLHHSTFSGDWYWASRISKRVKDGWGTIIELFCISGKTLILSSVPRRNRTATQWLGVRSPLVHMPHRVREGPHRRPLSPARLRRRIISLQGCLGSFSPSLSRCSQGSDNSRRFLKDPSRGSGKTCAISRNWH